MQATLIVTLHCRQCKNIDLFIILSVHQLIDFLDWGSRDRLSVIATLVGSVNRRRGWLIVHHEIIQLLGINVCYRSQSSVESSCSGSDSDSNLTLTHTHTHITTGTTTCRVNYCEVSNFSRVESSINILLKFISFALCHMA